MLDKPEARHRLRRKLEIWPEWRGSPVSINQGLELLDMVDRLEKEAGEAKRIIGGSLYGLYAEAHARAERLEREADWLAEKLLFHTGRKTLRGWREAARKAVEEEQCEK